MAETRDTRPKKQIPLRLSAKLYDQIAAWAEDDFRSVNGQIEYLLTECITFPSYEVWLVCSATVPLTASAERRC